MSIEIKQMIIKSTLVNDRPVHEETGHTAVDADQLRETLLDECRELIAESLNKMQER